LNLLDRHIFKSVLVSCAAAVGLFAFVLMLGNVIRDLLTYMLTGQLPLATFIHLTLLLVPFVASYALPMGILTGVLLTLGRLSADSEITAMRAAGVSVPRISRPVFIFAFLAAAGALYVNFEAMPHARVEYDRDLTGALRANPLNYIVPRTFIKDFPGYVLYIGDKHQGELSDFWFWQLDSDRRVTRLVRAASGHVDYDENKNELVLTLGNAQIEDIDDKRPEDFANSPPIGNSESYGPVHLSLNTIFARGSLRPPKAQWMTYAELQAERERLQAAPTPPGGARDHDQAVMKITLTIQEKFTTAAAVLSFALIGVPLGIATSRRETSANLGLAVALALGYYFLTVMVGWLDRHPEYRPDLLLWLPNLIFAGLGVWLFRRMQRR